MAHNPAKVNHPNLHFYPDWVLTLQEEIFKHHKHLIDKYELEQKPLDEVLGALGAEVNIVIDGEFDDKGMEGLAHLIMERLLARRTGSNSPIIIANSIPSDLKQ